MPTYSSRPGMGAVPYAGGVTFRVWAPFAPSVHVAGEFNGWSDTATPLVSEGEGLWSADVPGATAGQQYDFKIGPHRRIDPYATDVTHSVGKAIIVDPAAYAWRVNAFRMPVWNDVVIYEMHASTFPDDPAAAGALFDAIVGDLGYLRELGVNAIELMPTHEFPTDSSWGYNPSHVFAIESAYGGPDSLKRFVDEAHRHGIAVILDVVYNHLGPNDLSVWQFDGWFERWNGEEMGGIYFYNDWRARTPWGHKNRPDFGRPEVRRFIRDNALMWLESYRMDGLRFDATNYIRNVDGAVRPIDDPTNLTGWGFNLLRWINDEVDARQPWKLMIAEDMQGDVALTRPTAAGGAGFDSQWDAEFHHTLKRVLSARRDEERDMGAVRSSIERRLGDGPWQRVIFTESHDEVAQTNGKRRLPEEIDPGRADSWYARKRSTLGAAVVFTSPGIPMVFQGQEILEWIPFGDENRIDWEKYDRFRGIFTLYRDLIRLRRNWFDNTRGLRGDHVNVFHVNDTDKVLAYHRWQYGGRGDDVIVVLNFGARGYSSYTLGFPSPGAWYVRFNSDWSGYSPDFGNHPGYDTTTGPSGRDGLPHAGNVGIGPYSAVILSQ